MNDPHGPQLWNPREVRLVRRLIFSVVDTYGNVKSLTVNGPHRMFVMALEKEVH